MSRSAQLLVGALLFLLIGAFVLWPSESDHPQVTLATPSPTPRPAARTEPAPAIATAPTSTAPFALRRANPSLRGLENSGILRGQVNRQVVPVTVQHDVKEAKLRELAQNPVPPPAVVGQASLRRYGVTAQGIKSAVQDKMPELKECYEPWAEAHPELRGRIAMSFLIKAIDQPTGARIAEAKIVDGKLGSAALEGCIVNVFSSLQFERPEGGELRVTYPLQFDTTP